MEEYLKKKYLNEKEKKSSKKKHKSKKKLAIIDDDYEINKPILTHVNEIDDIYEDLQENQPIIEDIKILSSKQITYKNSFWKPIKSEKDAENNSGSVAQNRHDSDSDHDIKPSLNQLNSGRHDSDSDLELERPIKSEAFLQIKSEPNKSDSDLSPCREIKIEKDNEGDTWNKVKINFRDLQRKKEKPNPLEAEHMKKYQEEKATKESLYKIWGKGVKQIEERRTALAEIDDISSKPLSRHIDEVDLDKMLRAKVHQDDPLLAFFRKDRTQEPAKPDFKGSFPPNRFNIKPGYRWDGVDRSSGFETRWFQRVSNKTAIREMAYKWSVEDM